MFTLASLGVGGCSSSDLAFGGHGLDTGYGSLSGGEEETDTGDDLGASESATATATAGDSTTGMEDDGTDSGDTTGETGAGTSDGPGDCDPFAQDCEPGLKCSWVDGDYGPETVCIPLEEIPAEDGANCVVATAEDPSDPCDLGSICAYPDAYGIGVCTPMCGGEVAAPLCGENQVCQPCPDCPSLCLAAATPSTGSAPTGSCAPRPCSSRPSYAPWTSRTPRRGSTCEFANECAPGLLVESRPSTPARETRAARPTATSRPTSPVRWRSGVQPLAL